MRQVHSIICDDIRLERNNKVSLIGIYSTGIIVPSLPYLFPKFCISQEFEEAKGVQTIKLVLRGPKINLPAIEGKVTGSEKDEKDRVKINVCVGPLNVEEEGDYFIDTYLTGGEDKKFTRKFYVRLRPKSAEKKTED